YEIANRDDVTATVVGRALDLDAGYLSRLLRNFEKRGLITRKTSAEDGRQSHLALSERGRKAFAPLEQRSQQQTRSMLDKLDSAQQSRIVAAMHTIEQLLTNSADGARETKPGYVLRAPCAGDFGWIVSRHAQLYDREYGWKDPFEGLCAQIV